MVNIALMMMTTALMMTIMKMMMMMMMVTSKDAVQKFYNLFTALETVSYTHAHELISCKMSHAAWCQDTAQPSVSTELKSHKLSISLYWLEPLTGKAGEASGVLGETPPAKVSGKCHILNPENSSPYRDSNPHSSIKCRRTSLYTTCGPSVSVLYGLLWIFLFLHNLIHSLCCC